LKNTWIGLKILIGALATAGGALSFGQSAAIAYVAASYGWRWKAHFLEPLLLSAAHFAAGLVCVCSGHAEFREAISHRSISTS
jgi:hypothetical protein